MRCSSLFALAIGILVPSLLSVPAMAQATRTWVSGTGDDVNPCSRTAPCKTFAGAISKTATGGEINCIDPAGYGGVTISKAMTLNCGYTLGSILVSGGPGVTINAANALVVLRGIQLTGVSGGTALAGTIGVRIIAANSVSIEDCVITQFGQQGIADQRTVTGGRLTIKDTTVSYNASTGIGLGGVSVTGTVIDNVRSYGNLYGVAATSGNNVLIRRSVFSNNSTSGIEADAGAQINVNDTEISGNGNGIEANGAIRLSNSDISFNNTGISGATTSFGNNRIFGNGSPGSTPTGSGQQ